MPNPPDFSGQTFDNRYLIAEKIGEGGMAMVYLATDTASTEQVAIKIIHSELLTDGTALARLRREAQFGANFSHPNVCHIIRFGETDGGVAYVVMPYLPGEMLIERTWREPQARDPQIQRYTDPGGPSPLLRSGSGRGILCFDALSCACSIPNIVKLDA